MNRRLPMEVGAELTPVTQAVTLEDMILFEPPEEKNIHTDDGVARSAGLPAAIAAGVQFMANVFEMLYREFGFESVTGTVLDVRIRAPVFAGDVITARGRVSAVSRPGGAPRLSLEVWCENQRGEHVIGGSAECTAPGR